MIKDPLARLVTDAVHAAQTAGSLPLPMEEPLPPIEIGAPPDPALGDYATNVALLLAKRVRWPAREVGEIVAEHLATADNHKGLIESVQAVPSGFINFRLAPRILADALRTIVAAGDDWGRSDVGRGRRVLFEFVSANPNGPITIAHGRGGAIGDAIAALWERTGWLVSREFYVNDATNAPSLRPLALAVWKRYLRLLGTNDAWSNADASEATVDDEYPVETVTDLARSISDREGDAYAHLGPDEVAPRFQELILHALQANQRATLEAFGVRFDEWRSEAALHASGAVEQTLARLRQSGHAYEQNGALWLRSTRFGDTHDRVLVRGDSSSNNSAPTYIAADLAYHDDKFARGFDQLVNVFGADHTGYVARTKAGLAALGHDPDRLQVIVYQPVHLIEDGNTIKGGDHGTSNGLALGDVLEAIGRDAARFFLLLRPPDVPLGLDLTLAQARTQHNPLYRTQLALVRCCQALQKATAQGVPTPDPHAAVDLSLLTNPDERALIRKLADLPDEIGQAAAVGAPHRVVQYAMALADQFHDYCDRGDRHESAQRLFSPDNEALSQARLALTIGVRTALRSTLALVGVSAPDALT